VRPGNDLIALPTLTPSATVVVTLLYPSMTVAAVFSSVV
jgi:hypothetical protein